MSEPVEPQLSSFEITDSLGRAVRVRCRYSGPGLREGDKARVRYVGYDRKLTEFTALTGSFTGWHFEESTDERGSEVIALIGVVCAFAGWRQWRKAG